MVKPKDCTQEARRPMVMPMGMESGLSEDMTPGKASRVIVRQLVPTTRTVLSNAAHDCSIVRRPVRPKRCQSSPSVNCGKCDNAIQGR
jgi:hypothetical protein